MKWCTAPDGWIWWQFADWACALFVIEFWCAHCTSIYICTLHLHRIVGKCVGSAKRHSRDAPVKRFNVVQPPWQWRSSKITMHPNVRWQFCLSLCLPPVWHLPICSFTPTPANTIIEIAICWCGRPALNLHQCWARVITLTLYNCAIFRNSAWLRQRNISNQSSYRWPQFHRFVEEADKETAHPNALLCRQI